MPSNRKQYRLRAFLRTKALLRLLGLAAACGVVAWVTLARPIHKPARPAADARHVQGEPIDAGGAAASAGSSSAAADGASSAGTADGASMAAGAMQIIGAGGTAESKADAAAAMKALEEWKGGPDEYQPVGFAALSGFLYDPFLVMELGQSAPGSPQNSQIPEAIKRLKGRKVEISGFMMPIELQKDRVRSFLLIKNRLVCCFGMTVAMNDWVFVDMKEGADATFVNDVVVKVRGTLDVGEKIEDGMVMSVYRLSGDEMDYKGGY